MKNSSKQIKTEKVAAEAPTNNGNKRKGPIKRALITAGIMLAARFVIKKLTGNNQTTS
ncbi:MAG TPA: hypothetical protein VIK71_06595 [Flavobacteriales bacterium]